MVADKSAAEGQGREAIEEERAEIDVQRGETKVRGAKVGSVRTDVTLSLGHLCLT